MTSLDLEGEVAHLRQVHVGGEEGAAEGLLPAGLEKL